MSNYADMMDALRIYRGAMRAFVVERLKAKYKKLWWEQGVAKHFSVHEFGRLEELLKKKQTRKAAVKADVTEMVDMLDISQFRQIVIGNWKPVFEEVLKDRTVLDAWIGEVTEARNDLAHWAGKDVGRQPAMRFVHTCQLVVESFDEEAAAEIHSIWDRMDSAVAGRSRPDKPSKAEKLPPPPKQAEPPKKESGGPVGKSVAWLQPWRDVIVPHEDVRKGRYQQAEFAADLAQVIAGKAEAEYQDPREFFRRSFVTPDMAHLLSVAMERLSGKGGDPVVDLKTAFGGGKTHTLLALYHLVTSAKKVVDLPDVAKLLKAANLNKVPSAKAAVLVGTEIQPTEPYTYKEAAAVGAQVNTMWGAIAFQLGGFELFKIVQDADARGVAPGTEALVQVFEKAGPCVILIDELVAFLRNIDGKKGLPCGDYNSHVTFLQSLTEAVKRAPTTMLVVAIPESKMEFGDDRGERIAERIEHIIGRLSRPWQPVGAREAFEVVRRRLFQEIKDPAARDHSCEEYGKLYRHNQNDFPTECREAAYVERMKANYPIHPEIFDLLYERWSTLERFQRTRGVLRLMATTIHRLWEDGDASPMIMPASMPLYDARVRDELIRYVGDAWNAVIDSDVDGSSSEPREIDRENVRFDQIQAARRLTRTIFLGATPGEAAGNPSTRGVEDVRIRLGVVQPDEELGAYGDALNRLQQRLSFLYTSGQGRFWFGIQPNLNKTVADRVSRVSDEQAYEELDGRVRALAQKDRGDFASVHPCPQDPSVVPDDPAARLVVLSPRTAYKRESENGEADALQAARRILDERGAGPRSYRNMLAFVAADQNALKTILTEARRYLAWASIVREADDLNLDQSQQRRAKETEEKASQGLDAQLDDAYKWVLVPTQEGTETIKWEALILRSGELDSQGSIAYRASARLQTDELLITRWAPIHLQTVLDKWFWKDDVAHIGVKQLWDYFARYPYLPRLLKDSVLCEAIGLGVRDKDFFGYAQGVGEDGAYKGLAFGEPAPGVYIDETSVIVRKDIAAAQRPEKPAKEGPGEVEAPGLPEPEPPERRAVAKRFYGRVKLDSLRVASDAGKVADEVIAHLEGLTDADVEVILEIHAKAGGEGVPDAVQRTVTENARTLKFEEFGFEEE